MSKFFNDLKAGLEEIIEYKKGKISLRSQFISIPKPPAKYKAKDIKKIRQNKHYSQSILATILNVSVKTVQSWESGKRNPTGSTLRLLEIIDKGLYQPDITKKL